MVRDVRGRVERVEGGGEREEVNGRGRLGGLREGKIGVRQGEGIGRVKEETVTDG